MKIKLFTLLFFITSFSCKKSENASAEPEIKIVEEILVELSEIMPRPKHNWQGMSAKEIELEYRFEVYEGCEAEVRLDRSNGVVYCYICSDAEHNGIVWLPIRLRSDLNYANLRIYSKDVNGDGYNDLVIANDQGDTTFEWANLYKPEEKYFMADVTKQEKAYDIDGVKGFISMSAIEIEDENIEVALFNDDGSIWLKWNISDISDTPELLNRDSRNLDMYKNWLVNFEPWKPCSEEFNFLEFKCTGEDSECYTVIVNENTGETKKLKKLKGLRIMDFKEYLVGEWTFLDLKDPNYKIVDTPNDNGRKVEIKNPEYQTFIAQKMSGDWIYLYEQQTEKELGWTRWRKGNRLLVDTYYEY